MSSFTVTVPATTANLGPGFDCLGAALGLYNRVIFTVAGENDPALTITVKGDEAAGVSLQSDNLIYQSLLTFYQHTGQSPPPLCLDIHLGVPLARGLGSSATAIVAGLVGANTIAGNPLNPTDLLNLAIALEGHPDNVAPALMGHCQLSVQDGDRWEITAIPWHENLVPVLAIPDFELSTEAARSVLPMSYPRTDAIFNAAHLALLIRALETGNGSLLRVAMEDRIHQPYRQRLISGYDALKQVALASGAYNLAISGAGPTLLAIANPDNAPLVAQRLREAWQAQGITANAHVLELDRQGAQIET